MLKRYKRFLADIQLPSQEVITVHVPNTGPMTNCWKPNDKVLLSFSNNKKRKYPYTLELIHNGFTWIGINTHRTNLIVEEALKKGVIKELASFNKIQKEVSIGESRLDFLISNDSQKCYVEVKNVTLIENQGTLASFPDAITLRGQKHLKELINLQKAGFQTAMIFVVQREDALSFSANNKIDPAYSFLLQEAHEIGVKILPYVCKLNHEEVILDKRIPLTFNSIN